MSATIKDIAKVANVSHTTVSRALNDSPLINRETKARIRMIAQELNYTPNFSAKSLVLDRSYHLGLFFSTINTGTSPVFFYETVRGVNRVIQEPFNLVVKGIDQYANFNGINRKSFDGIVVMSQSLTDNAFLEYLSLKEIPCVVLNREYNRSTVPNILSDDQQGAYKLAAYLINQGHKRIALIEGKEDFLSSQKRKSGFRHAMRDHAITEIEELHVKGNYTLESGHAAMKLLLTKQPLPTAVFCLNDDMAVGAMKAAMEAGFRIPEDISIAGFDDNVFSAYLSPALTTVKRPVEQISQKGTALLLDMINNNKAMHGETHYLETELIIRESVKTIS